MAEKPSTIEFGKRRPAPQPSPSPPPPKRSRHVALLVMGTFAVGGGAYALMGPENCQPAASGVAVPQTTTACTSRGSSGGGYARSSHFSFFGGASSSHGSSSGTTESGGVSRGGFGSFAHAFGFSGG